MPARLVRSSLSELAPSCCLPYLYDIRTILRTVFCPLLMHFVLYIQYVELINDILNPPSETYIKIHYDEVDGITRFKVRTLYICMYVRTTYVCIVYKREPSYNEVFDNKFLDITEK